MSTKQGKLFKPNHDYEMTFRNGETKKLSQACSLTNSTPTSFIKNSALTAAKAAVIASK